MKELSIQKFYGIAPRYGASAKPGVATIAQNVDLTSGKLRQLLEGRRSIPPNLYPYDSLSWPINGVDIGLTLTNGVLMKTINGVLATLGHDPPEDSPSAASQTTRIDLTGSVYQWTLSGLGDSEYYVEASGGGDPGLSEPDQIRVDLTVIKKGTVGSLTADQWDYADNDTLGFSTVYIRLIGGDSPTDLSTTNVYHEVDYGNVSAGEGGAVAYFVTTTRDVGGFMDESGPSGVSSSIEALGDKILVTRPTVSDALVTHWNIYRLSSNTSEYLFVAKVEIGDSTYLDDLADSDLGEACTTWYTSDQGNEITWAKAPVGIDGISTEPYSGMLFAWDAEKLYWNEPGFPDAWPVYYYMYFPSAIKRVIPLAGAVCVLTANGPFRVDGTHAELLQPSNLLSKEPCPGTAAYPSRNGALYLSDSGIAVCNLSDVNVMTDGAFTEEWFLSNVSIPEASIVENDGIVYLIHSQGVLVGDMRVSPGNWQTLDVSSPETWRWRSSDINFNGKDSSFQEVELRGFGRVSIRVYLDGIEVASKTMNLSAMERDRTIRLPTSTIGRALQIDISGDAAGVNELFVRAN